MKQVDYGLGWHLRTDLACNIVNLLEDERVNPVEALSVDSVVFSFAPRALLLAACELLKLTKRPGSFG